LYFHRFIQGAAGSTSIEFLNIPDSIMGTTLSNGVLIVKEYPSGTSKLDLSGKLDSDPKFIISPKTINYTYSNLSISRTSDQGKSGII